MTTMEPVHLYVDLYVDLATMTFVLVVALVAAIAVDETKLFDLRFSNHRFVMVTLTLLM